MSVIQKFNLNMPKSFAEAALKAAGVNVVKADQKLANNTGIGRVRAVIADAETVKQMLKPLKTDVYGSYKPAEKVVAAPQPQVKPEELNIVPIPGYSLSHAVKPEGLKVKDTAFVSEFAPTEI